MQQRAGQSDNSMNLQATQRQEWLKGIARVAAFAQRNKREPEAFSLEAFGAEMQVRVVLAQLREFIGHRLFCP